MDLLTDKSPRGLKHKGLVIGKDPIRARGPIITVDMPTIATMATIAITGTITIIGTDMQRPDAGIMVNGGTTA
jgi:hypothetical protein